VLGVYWGAWVRHDPQACRSALDQLAHWCAQGKLSCHVDKVYPLAETAQAIKALAERRAIGKLVVKP
jgi:NADPH2:quinone reductase